MVSSLSARGNGPSLADFKDSRYTPAQLQTRVEELLHGRSTHRFRDRKINVERARELIRKYPDALGVYNFELARYKRAEIPDEKAEIFALCTVALGNSAPGLRQSARMLIRDLFAGSTPLNLDPTMIL